MKLRTDDLDNLFSTTLASALTDSALTIYLNRVPTNASEGFLVLDPNDSSKREVIYFNEVGENYISCPASGGRGQAGTSAVSHDSGAVVKMMFLREHWKPLRDAIYTGWVELDLDASYSSSTTISIPGNVSSLLTEGKNVKLSFETSGVKTFSIDESVFSSPNTIVTLSGNAVEDETITKIEIDLLPVGSSDKFVDTNRSQSLENKTLVKPTVNASKQNLASDVDGATISFDLSESNIHTVILGGNRTLALSSVSVGQAFILRLKQDGTGGRTVTWFSTINWAGGSAPTLSTGANKIDVFGFLCTAENQFDGFVIGQNI